MATITKKLGFENLLSNPSLNRDSTDDGVADGWEVVYSGSVDPEYLMDPEGAQIISIYNVNVTGFAAVESEQMAVTEEAEYTLSVDAKCEGDDFTPGPEGTGPQLHITWLDEDEAEIDTSTTDVFEIDPDQWTRISTTATAPTGAIYAKVRLAFQFTELERGDGSDEIKGLLWFRNAQFQPGDTATDYEENDFFVVMPTAKGYSQGWQISETGGRNNSRCYIPTPQEPGLGSWPGMEILFFIPENAADNPKFSIWMNIADLLEEDFIEIFYDGNRYASYRGGWPNPFRTPEFDAGRGWNSVLIRIQRPQDMSTTAEGAFVDDFYVSWEEEEDPAPIVLPEGKDVVKYIDFEGGVDPFFAIAPKAHGYDYGFERTFRQRHSGWYSFGVADTDTGGVDDIGYPPTIPGNSKAAAMIRFNVPITAIEPELSLKAKFIARARDTGRIYLNGDIIWERNEQHEGWDSIDVALIPGTTNELLLEYDKGEGNYGGLDDSIFIDDVIVSYNIPRKPTTYIATAPETVIQTEAKTFSAVETFETTSINPFFTVENPGKIISGGGSSQYPEAGWIRTDRIAYEGKYSYRPLIERLSGEEDAAIDFTFKVPFGVRNPKMEVWCYVETKRSLSPIGSAKYPRLFDELRIWINNSIWKEFIHCSPNLSSSVHYSLGNRGNPGNDYACPWGKWWKETIPLTPGQSYTISFECQPHIVRPSGTRTTSGRNIQAIDNISVTWDESAGEVMTTPPEPLIFLDNRDGYRHLSAERGGAEMAPISFGEYQVYDEPGAVRQYTAVDPRPVDLPVRITPGLNGDGGRMELRRMIRHLVSQVANKHLALIVAYPEGDLRMLRCWFQGEMGREERSTLGVWWRKVILSFRAFDPFWYGNRVVVDGDFETDRKWVSVANEGDYYTYPFIKVYGPINKPVLRLTGPPGDATTHKEIRFNNFDLPAGRHIVIDTRPGQKTVILDDGTSLYQYLTGSELFNIPVGEYGIKLEGSETDDNTKVVVEFEPAYWGV